MQLAVLGAVVVGGAGGGIAALLVAPEPAPPRPAPVTAAPPPPRLPVAPAPVPPPRSAADPQVELTRAMTAVLTRFAGWARDHAGEPCPDLAALDATAPDPWGHPLALTCTDQPADQRIGAVSAGPDGIAGTGDDVASWTLGRELAELVRGARWTPARTRANSGASPPRSAWSRGDDAGATGSRARVGSSATSATGHPAPPPGSARGDDIPTRR
jgi:hypothetical protein